MICNECGKEFEKRVHNQKWCSLRCKCRVSDRKRDRKRNRLPERKKQLRAVYEAWVERKVSEGLCVKCGKFVPSEGNRVCSFCIEEVRITKGY